jgi:glutamate-1-semialdehyde 2,1-aminomutase
MGSEKLLELANQVIPGGINSTFRRLPRPVVVARAKGARVWDTEGNEYVDYLNGLGPTILGHCDDRVSAAVHEATNTLDITGIGTTVYEIDAAVKITQHIPSADQVLLCNAGTEATFHAVRLSRAITGKTELIRIDGNYHGWHDYLPPLPTGLAAVGAGVLYDANKHTHIVQFNNLDSIADVVQKTGDQVAAIILEPLMHNAGCIVAEPGYLEGLRRYCNDKGIILIFDEVITCFRHHLGGYQTICGVTPDLTTIGKAMGNGYPVSAICGRRDLMSHFNTTPTGDVSYGGTYNAHASDCAAIGATIRLLEDGSVHKHIYALGDRIRRGLNEIIDRVGLEAFAVGYGSVWLVYFRKDRAVRRYTDLTGTDYHVAQDARFRDLMLEKRFLVPSGPRRRCYISAALTEADVDNTLDAAEASLRQVASELRA